MLLRIAKRARQRPLLFSLSSLVLLLIFLWACMVPKNGPSQSPTPPGNTPGIGPASCSAGQDWCQGSCKSSIDYVSDNNNCGRCGNICSIGESCTGGSCNCAPGYEKCMGSCVNSATFLSDSSNCGRCGNMCGGGESCVGGSCRKL